MNPSIVSYKNHRFPPQIIAHAVWHYFRFPLGLRLVEVLPTQSRCEEGSRRERTSGTWTRW
jgi:transposase-like protein